MVTVPAFVWRSGTLGRALLCGLAVGAVLGILAWVDSGMWLAGLCVLVILGIAYGIVMPRRMSRYWPGSRELGPGDRYAVVRAARRGDPIGDARLATAVGDYARGMRAAAESLASLRWLVWLVLVVALGMALWDNMFGSVRNAVVSAVYLVLLLLELLWWPRRRDRLLANADQAALRSGRDCPMSNQG